MAKVVTLHDTHGSRTHFDVSEIKAQKLNQWKGWLCSIGKKSIHIDFDGTVWSGTCKVGGPLGDIYTGWEAPKQMVVCNRFQCNCGTEIKLPKARPDHLEKMEAEGTETETPIVTEEVVAVTYNRELIIHVQWDLGRFCNFDCSYCLKGPNGIHNDTEPHKPIDVLLRTVDKLHEWNSGEPMKFCFSGGEPTLHPDFITLCSYIKEKSHQVHLTTNGSQGPRYWKQLVPNLDVASISVHFEYTKETNLLKTLAVAIDHRMKNPRFGVEIKLMTKPEDWDRMLILKDQIRELPGFVETKSVLQIAPLRVMLGKHELMDYTDEQISQFGVVK